MNKYFVLNSYFLCFSLKLPIHGYKIQFAMNGGEEIKRRAISINFFLFWFCFPIQWKHFINSISFENIPYVLFFVEFVRAYGVCWQKCKCRINFSFHAYLYNLTLHHPRLTPMYPFVFFLFHWKRKQINKLEINYVYDFDGCGGDGKVVAYLHLEPSSCAQFHGPHATYYPNTSIGIACYIDWLQHLFCMLHEY